MTSIVTSSDLRTGLSRIGVEPECHLMVHASLSRFGFVEGGASTVVTVLRCAAGSTGAVIAPSFRDAIRSADYALRACSGQCPQRFCPSREPGCTGVVGETLRHQPDAIRSCHPTHSWAGVGAGAAFLLEGHGGSSTPCGRDSPFFRLLQCDGVVALLGVGVESLTSLHAVEDARNVPYLSAFDPPRRHATYTTSGRRIQYRYAPLLEQALVTAGLLRSTTIGAATCHALRARDLGSFLWLATEDDPWCLVLRPAHNRFDPNADARAKTARMATVWNQHPDRGAWKLLLAASERPTAPHAFAPASDPQAGCPAYRGVRRGYHRCAANDPPPWERFTDFPPDEPGVATCQQCNWRGPDASSDRFTP